METPEPGLLNSFFSNTHLTSFIRGYLRRYIVLSILLFEASPMSNLLSFIYKVTTSILNQQHIIIHSFA